MNSTLLTGGIVCIAAAIVGGGFEAFGAKVPLVNSKQRQLMLGFFGVLLLVAAVAPDDRARPDMRPVSPHVDSHATNVETLVLEAGATMPLFGNDSGGSPFSEPCHSGDAIVGFDGFTRDTFIYQLAPICVPLKPGVKPPDNVETSIIHAGQQWEPPSHGSSTGQPFTVRCSGDGVVSRVRVQTTHYVGGGASMSYFVATCSTFGIVAGQIVSHSAEQLEPVGRDYAGSYNKEINCGQFGALGGIVGRAGSWLDAIGFECRNLRITAAAT